MPFMNNIKELCLVPGKASGDIASFEASAAPLVSCICTINPVQSGSGDPSPSNIRPITGHDNVTITQKDGNNTVVDTTTITFPDTLYGASLDVGSGVLTDEQYKLDDFTNISVALNAQGTVVNTFYLDTIVYRKRDKYIASNIFKNAPLDLVNSYLCEVSDNMNVNVYRRIYFSLPSTISTGAQAKQWLIDNNVEFVYNRESPVELSTVPEQLNSILGDNNFYHDGNGPIDITYIRRYQHAY